MNFDGENRLILLDESEIVLDVKTMYYTWKKWAADDKNIVYPLAMRYVGGDIISDTRLGLTFFMTNGWKIKPASKNYNLTVNGNLYSDDKKSSFVKADGDYNVLITNRVSNLIDIVPFKLYNNITGTQSLSKGGQNSYSGSSGDKDWTISQ